MIIQDLLIDMDVWGHKVGQIGKRKNRGPIRTTTWYKYPKKCRKVGCNCTDEKKLCMCNGDGCAMEEQENKNKAEVDRYH